MLTLILQKIVHKKWMVLCLLIGNILLLAVAVSYPLYRTSSFQRMLTDEFEAYMDETGNWPAVVSASHYRNMGKEGVSYEKLMSYMNYINTELGVPIAREIQFLNTSIMNAYPVVLRAEHVTRQVRISAMSGIEEQVTLFAGRLPENGLVAGEYLEVMVSEDVADSMNILLDEVYELEETYFLNGEPLRVKVVGMFYATNADDAYWVDNPSNLNRDFFVSMDTFMEFFTGEEAEMTYGLKKSIYEFWDYEKIAPSQIAGIVETTHRLVDEATNGSILGDNVYEGIIENYSAKAKRVEASLLILQMPVLALLLAFIYMISSQMLSMEQSEISVMKSRGAKGGQIVGMYFIQNLILCGIAVVIGVPLGRFFCSMMGLATDFMEFAGGRPLEVHYSADIIVYILGAVVMTMVMTILPVLQYSRVSIVHLKRSIAGKKASLWKKIGLDIICIAVALYGWWDFSKNQEMMMEQVLTGEALNPFLYLCSSLFLFGCGLFALRIQPFILKLFFMIGKKHFSPAPYVSFVEGIRGGKRQEFIMLFMVLTVALGIHNTTVARTIVANAEHNASYVNGADVVLREIWADNAYTKTADEPLEYIEPDYGKYTIIEGIDKTTKVMRRRMELLRSDINATFLGIQPAEFYEISQMPEDILPFAFHEYLNVMASSEYAVLVSENFMTNKGYKLGDTIEIEDDNEDGKIRMTIVGFFPYWPSYKPVSYSLTNDGSLVETPQYMVVASLNMLQRELTSYPYEVWMSVETDTNGLYQFVKDHPKVVFGKFNDLEVIKEELRSDTLFQGTNGILTMSFVVVLILCGVGYLIYFILSIRSRELLFGVLRAMGMRKSEITTMLLLEQIFCGLYAIAAGAGIGLLGSRMFVPMIQNAYAASDQVLPLTLITSRQDLLQLFAIIGIVMIVCLFVLTRIVAHLNITKALKLGED